MVEMLGHGWVDDESSLRLILGRNGLEDLMYDALDILSRSQPLDPSQFGSEASSYRELLFLSSIMHHQATVPIDKVYSVYTILTYLNLALSDPDYHKPPLEAYQELTEAWIRSRKKLSIIVLSVQHRLEDDSPAGRCRPSWVPDWAISDAGSPDSPNFGLPGCFGSIELLDRRMHPDYPCYASSASLVDPEGAFKSPAILSAQGISIGRIKERFAVDAMDDSVPNDSNTFQDMFRSTCQYISTMPASSYPTGENPATALLYCATYIKATRHVDWQDFEDCFNLMLYPSCTDSNRNLVELKSSREAPDRLMDFLASLHLLQLEASDHQAELNRLWSMLAMCDNPEQAFFIVDSGYIGSAFHTIQLEDEVFLLAGCPWPMILRPCEGGYKFIAPAYVHGVMNGERWPADSSSLVDVDIV